MEESGVWVEKRGSGKTTGEDAGGLGSKCLTEEDSYRMVDVGSVI